ncbi:MAG: tRNA (adenosine(37)-N6)-dimethylallyltransferase MiaA [Rhizobiales bacterium]|nr:tRNA (adenosine(37)-N6)-dimethylallyltransferase MiaA [Hyphomicrobiales bacterium]
MTKPILIAGATASGKSSLALALAEEFDGVIVNADSCQVYKELSILSARPSKEDMERVPHRLYGHVSGAEAYSTGAWLEDVSGVLEDIRKAGKRAIFVGGTGLYYKALLEGLSQVPTIDEEIRQFWRDEALRLGAPALHEILREKDPLMAKELKQGDTQRIIRALEVIDGTGQSLKLWQETNSEPLLSFDDVHGFALTWDRAVLYERIDRRFEEMVAVEGNKSGLGEVKALLEHGFDESLPIMRALGVPELSSYLRGDRELDQAVALAQQQTRRYAKRQLTWLRRNMITWDSLNAQYMKRLLPEIFSKIHEDG